MDILPTELLDEILAYAVDKFEDALSLNLTHSKFHHQAHRRLWHSLLIEVSPCLGLDRHIWYRRCWNNVFTFFSEYEILRQYVRALIVIDPRGGGPMASSNDIGRCLRLFGRLECLELARVPVQLIISALRHCPRIRQMELRACTISVTDASSVLLRLPQLRMLSIVECTLIQGENRPPGFSWFAPGVLEAVKAWRLCNIHALAVVESHRYNAGPSVLAWIPTLGS